MRPEHLHYDVIKEYLQKSIQTGSEFLFDTKLFEAELRRLWETYDFPPPSLQSFLRNLHVSHVKKTAPAVKSALPTLVDDYVQGRASIKDLARKCNYPPYLLARYIVEAVTTTDLYGSKKALAEAMRDPLQHLGRLDVIRPCYRDLETDTTTTTTRLAHQVQDAMEADPMYGPKHDKERHSVGVEFEVVLEYKLKAMSESRHM
jgi:hypothetical protein